MEVCALLEAQGIACWIAPRDVAPGAKWDEAIVDAIAASTGFLLILTEAANQSSFVGNEVNHAFAANKPIFTFRAEDVQPNKSLGFYLARHHWTDGFIQPRAEQVAQLAAAVKGTPAPSSVAKRRPNRFDVRRWAFSLGLSLGSAALAGIAVWGALGEPPRPDSLPAIRFQIERPSAGRITSSAFAVSPDGRFFAFYLTAGDGQTILAVRTLATGETRQVPGSTVLNPRVPFWSADSRYLAFVNTTATLAFDVTTGTTRQLCACRAAQGGAWNADGVILIGGARPGDPVRRLLPQDQQVVPVTQPDAAKQEQDTWPVFLPDGRRFLFTRTTRGSAPVTYVGSIDGGEATRVADGSRRFLVVGPNGSEQWLLSLEAAGLVIQTIDSETLVPVGSGSENRLFEAARDTHANDWSRNGRWLIYTISKNAANPLDLDLWVVTLDGGSVGSPAPYLTEPAREAQAEFSPDGRFVAYTAVSSGSPAVYVQTFPDPTQGKWLVSVDGGSEPHWSPDGRELFYVAGRTLMAVPVRLAPGFVAGSPVRLFEAPIEPWYVNDSDRTQVGEGGNRFLILADTGQALAPPVDVVVNWFSLVRR